MAAAATVPRHGALRDTLSLVASASGSQVILIAALPLLSRLYSPAEFGAFGVYAAVLNVGVAVACLRFDTAIPLPAGEHEALRLLALAIVSALATVLLAAIGLLAVELFHGLPYWAWLFAPAVLCGGAYQAITYWCVRRSLFREVARTRLTQGAVTVAGQIALVPFAAGALGLAGGDVAGRACGIARPLRIAWSEARSGAGIAPAALAAQARVHWRFPAFAAPSALINIAGLTAIVPLFAWLYGSAATGGFVLAQRAIAVPVTLLTGAVAQVYLNESARRMRENPETSLQLFRSSARWLALLAAMVLAGGVVAGLFAFPLIFGSQWDEAGVFAALLAFSAAGTMLVSPLSQIVFVANRQLAQAGLDIVRLVAVLGTVFVAARLGASPTVAAGCYSAAMAACYAAFFALYYATARSIARGS